MPSSTPLGKTGCIHGVFPTIEGIISPKDGHRFRQYRAGEKQIFYLQKKKTYCRVQKTIDTVYSPVIVSNSRREDDHMRFAASRLKQLREGKGWTQKDAASKIGIARQQYADYESGKHCPTLDSIGKMSKAFEISFAFFVIENGEQ